ncbi:unnamed protein product [Merluccius merluccius]
MITRPAGFPDVHELILSKDDFERKEKNKEEIYSGVIQNRKVGDSSHILNEGERFLRDLIAEETEKESFTAVVVMGIHPEHATFLKNDFNIWTTELAHIYHYYIHGTNGNVQVKSQKTNINIQISLREKPTRCPRVVNLCEVDNDMQTLYINSAVDTFEFKVCTESGGSVEGLLRYHPFLYDHETYPQDPLALLAPLEDEEEEGESGAGNRPRGRRHIFECFWNGRLIPYTTVSEFEWCRPGKHSPVPAECYSRFSGVLFADDRFQVSTNKLTFMDLELQLRKKETIFTRIVNGQEQRVKIQREFSQWLKSCHERWDKQVRFVGFKGTMTRTDVAVKRMQHPWATFSSVEWDNKRYEAGQLIKSQRTQPIVYGSVVRFLLYGDHDGDVYATGGQVEVSLEPNVVCNESKIFLISKIDRTVTNATIKKFIDNELAKLPDKLRLDWPEGNCWSQKAVQPAGTQLGPLNVEILNKKGEAISRLPSSNQVVRKLVLELRVVWHGPNGDQEIHFYIAQHSAKWAFWFKAMENLTKLGKYTLELKTVLSESNASAIGGKQLPSYKLNFTITEGKAERFTVGAVNPALRVGVAFDMVLTLMDAFDHPAPPPPDLTPQLTCRGLDVSYEKTTSSGTQFTIHGVKVHGKVANYHCKPHDLKVALPGLVSSLQTLKISLLPGEPHSLSITPEQETITVVNGDSLTFNVEIHDEAGNITAQPKLVVYCQVLVPQHTPVSVDCSTTGAGLLVSKPISMRDLKEQHRLVKAKFDLPSQKQVSAVWKELKVVPSSRVARLEVYFQGAGGPTVLKDRELVEWQAGDLLENLHYRLYDEGRRLLPLSPGTASKMKVNWMADLDLEDLVQGKLPNIQVPTQVKNKHFYQISYLDQQASVETSFSIEPRPDAPSQLRATLDHQTPVKMGELLPGDIHLQLLDQYGNVAQKMTPECVEHVKVRGEDLDSSSLNVSWQESSQDVVVTGVRFRPGRPGPRELTFNLRTLVEQVKVMVTAGPPTKLQLVSGPPQPLQVLNEQGIPSPFVIQLCDAWGNPSPDKRVVVALTPSSPDLKVKSSVKSQPVDQEGKASFTVQRVAGPKEEFSLEFRGMFNQKPVPGPSVPLTLVLDPNKPVSLAVGYDTAASCPAGGAFPVFSVTVVSEEGSPITKVNPANLSMSLWRGETPCLPPPAAINKFTCSKPLENEKDHFYFRDKLVPQQTGKYSLQFSLTGQKLLRSQQYVLDVVANEPVKLAPDRQSTTPVVSNNEEPANRVLVNDLTLRIRDTFGNPTAQEAEGRVEVRVTLSPGDADKDLPLLEAPGDHLHLQLTQGTAHVSRLCIKTNSPGSDGTKYVLVFDAQISGTTLAPFELPFLFYNDADNQRQMRELSRRKDELSAALVTYKNVFKAHAELLNLLTCLSNIPPIPLHMLSTSSGFHGDVCLNPRQVLHVEAAIREQTAVCSRLSSEPRRTCAIADPFRGTHDVLGKVCHLALVEDDDVAAVLSWHIQGEMDCVVTVTTVAARRIYDHTQGRQQVLPLDSMYADPNYRPLPHLGSRTPEPPGNPIFARDLLIYPEHTESCKIVFKNLLGNTILIDDLDAGNAYRKIVVQSHRPCPTILTRQGDRISAMGKFGGTRNRAPGLSGLRGQVFGAPLSAQYYALMGQIELLGQYRVAMQASHTAKAFLDAHIQGLRAPDMLRKEEEMEQKQQQLEDIVSQLECVPVRVPVKRTRVDPGAGEPSRNPQKRPRGRSRSSLNWCAYVVHRNVSCVVPDPLGHFGQQRLFRPTYRIGYKLLTELQWRCCPGYQGYDCKELKGGGPRQPPPQHPHSPETVGQHGVERGQPHPWRAQAGRQGGQEVQGGSSTMQHMEEEIQRLSQMVLDMQAAMTDMSSSLRLDLQEDASKMLVTLLHDLRQPASARGGDTQMFQLQGLSLDHGSLHEDEVLGKINQLGDTLETKSNALDELQGRVDRHDGELRLLMDVSQGSLAMPTSSSASSSTSSSSSSAVTRDTALRAYMDEKLAALREELMEGMEIKMADLKSSCDYKIMSVQEECEGQETNYLSLAELMDSKESDLRKEILELRTKVEELESEKVVVEVSGGETQASEAILARLENVELRLNLSEKNAEVHHLLREQKFGKQEDQGSEDLRRALEDRMTSVEDRISSLLEEKEGDHLNSPSRIAEAQGLNALQSEMNSFRNNIHMLELRREVRAEAEDCRLKTQEVGREVAGVEERVGSLQKVCDKLDPISGSLQRIKEGLDQHLSGLWTCVRQLNGTLRAQGWDMAQLRGTLQDFQDQASGVSGDLLTGSTQATTGKPLPQVMETGQAGPPGTKSASRPVMGTDGSMAPEHGYAGAPGEQVSEQVCVCVSPGEQVSDQVCVCVSPGEQVCFSAGLSLRPVPGEVGGIVRFNKVLVNDGGHYDPHTGVFTAPLAGRYHLSGVLTAQRGGKVEAVLSVANRSVQKLNAAGFPSGAAAAGGGPCGCGGAVATLNLVLSLRRGDRAALVMTAGKLATSASPEVLSTFSAVLLYPSPSDLT